MTESIVLVAQTDRLLRGLRTVQRVTVRFYPPAHVAAAALRVDTEEHVPHEQQVFEKKVIDIHPIRLPSNPLDTLGQVLKHAPAVAVDVQSRAEVVKYALGQGHDRVRALSSSVSGRTPLPNAM